MRWSMRWQCSINTPTTIPAWQPEVNPGATRLLRSLASQSGGKMKTTVQLYHPHNLIVAGQAVGTMDTTVQLHPHNLTTELQVHYHNSTNRQRMPQRNHSAGCQCPPAIAHALSDVHSDRRPLCDCKREFWQQIQHPVLSMTSPCPAGHCVKASTTTQRCCNACSNTLVILGEGVEYESKLR